MNDIEPNDAATVTSTNQTDMTFVTPCVSKLTTGNNMTATGVTGRKLKDGERCVIFHTLLFL